MEIIIFEYKTKDATFDFGEKSENFLIYIGLPLIYIEYKGQHYLPIT